MKLINQLDFAETEATLHNIQTIRNSNVAESVVNQMSDRTSIIN